MLDVCPRDCQHMENAHSLAQGHPKYTFPSSLTPRPLTFRASSDTPFQYQNTFESTYWRLPRPPQTPAAPFKRLYRK